MKRYLSLLMCALLACFAFSAPYAAAEEYEGIGAHPLWEFIGTWQAEEDEYSSVELIYDIDDGYILSLFITGAGDFYAFWTGDDEYADTQRFVDEDNAVTFILEPLGGAFLLSAETDETGADLFGGGVYLCVPAEEEEWDGEEWYYEEPEVFLNLDGTCVVGMAPFADGIGWVQYMESKELITAAVHIDGGRLFSLTGPVWYVSPFEDGAAFAVISDNAVYYPNADYNVGCYAQSSPVMTHEVILDSRGSECYATSYSKTSRTDSEEHIICSGGGKFVVLRRESGLEGIVCRLGTIDMYGNVVDPFKSYDGVGDNLLSSWKSLFSGARGLPGKYGAGYGSGSDGDPGDGYPRYIGEGAYYLTGGKVYLPAENRVVQLKGGKLLSDCYGGKVLSCHDGTYYIQNVRSDADSFEYASEFRREIGRDIDRFRAKFCYCHWDRMMPNDLYYHDHAYYNINMERVIEIEPYPSLKMDGSVFNEGYALILIVGADGNTYVTVIDDTGEVQFEPFRATKTSSRVSDGYFVALTDTGCAVYDVQGNYVRYLCPASEAGYFRDISGGHVTIFGAVGSRAMNRIFRLAP